MIDRPIRYTPSSDELPSGICECGCGQATTIATHTLRKLRWFKGHPRPFVVGHHARQTRRRVYRNIKPFGVVFTVAEAAYLAGIIDGEGHLQIRDRAFRIVIGNTDASLMAWLTGLIGGGIFERPGKGRVKDVHVWSIGHRNAVNSILRQTVPYMIIKKERAEAILAMIDDLENGRHDDTPYEYVPTDTLPATDRA